MKHLPTPQAYVQECLDHLVPLVAQLQQGRSPLLGGLSHTDLAEELDYQSFKLAVLQACKQAGDFSPARILADSQRIDQKFVALFGVKDRSCWYSQQNYVKDILKVFQWTGFPSWQEFGA